MSARQRPQRRYKPPNYGIAEEAPAQGPARRLLLLGRTRLGSVLSRLVGTQLFRTQGVRE